MIKTQTTNINDKLQKIFITLTFLIAVSFPFGIKLLRPFLIFWALTGIGVFFQNKALKRLDTFQKIFLILIIVYFFLHIIGVFFSENKINAYKILLIKLNLS